MIAADMLLSVGMELLYCGIFKSWPFNSPYFKMFIFSRVFV